MNNIITKTILLYLLSFLVGSSYLYAAQSVFNLSTKNSMLLLEQNPKMLTKKIRLKKLETGQKIIKKTFATDLLPRVKRKLLADGYCRSYKIPYDIVLFVIYFLHDNPLQYKNKELPKDLSEQDLTGFDFTGCQFTHTNLAGTILTNVILTNTTCDYRSLVTASFEEVYGRKQNKSQYSRKSRLTKLVRKRKNQLNRALKAIAECYPTLDNHQYKAQLLQIASGFSRLFPDHHSSIFKIKWQYWFYCLRLLKDQLPTDSPRLYYLLEDDFKKDIDNYCWKTDYPHNRLTLYDTPSDINFATCVDAFEKGLEKYNCQSTIGMGLGYYKDEIIRSIQFLGRAYPNIKNKVLQREAWQIAIALSRSYQIEKATFLHHYLFYQNRLIRLSNLTGCTISYSPILSGL